MIKKYIIRKDSEFKVITDFELDDKEKKIINNAIAVELIRKLLYNTDKITKSEFKDIVKNAYGSVKINLNLS